MPQIDIRLTGEGAFSDVHPENLRTTTKPIRIAALENGMMSGAPSIAIGLFMEDGECCFVETSLKLFLTAADALKARYGDPR